RLRQEGARVVVLDLTAVGRNISAVQWYSGLLVTLGRQLDCEDELVAFWRAHRDLGPLQRFMLAVENVVLGGSVGERWARRAGAPAKGRKREGNEETEHRLVIFLDEIDAVRSLPFSTDELFAAIRECYNRRAREPAFERLTFCLMGVASPSDLVRDPRLTPFNIGRRIELTDFTEAEAAPLALGLSHHHDTKTPS